MGEGKLTPLTTPTPLNRQSRNIAHVITSTISPHTPHLVKIAPGVTSPRIAKVTTQFSFYFFLCTQNLSTDLELRPLNRFWHAIHQQTRIHAGLTERSLYNRFALKNLPKCGFWGIFFWGEGSRYLVGTPLGMQWPPIYVVWWKNYGDAPNTLVCTLGKEITKKT